MLETLLRKAGRELANYQVARFWKIPEEMQQTPCDFMGFTSAGRVILIEAKEVKRAALPIAGSPGLLPHQYCALEECHRAGGLAILCWARAGDCAVMLFDDILTFSSGRKSIPWNAIPEIYLRPMHRPDAHLRLLDAWLPIGSVGAAGRCQR